MAIHNEEVQEMETGIVKGIEASAMGLIMENLQRYQYQFPIKSTVRELVSNGLDAVADRNVALDILLNGAPVDKYFVEREGALYKDSKFDPTYYDPKWLSDDDKVYVIYQEGKNQQKDCIIIEDFGTGLGGNRLRGYMQLGYSTKRLSKLPLGKFGIGAKSALSVGVQFYTVESRYNGMLFRFNIYSSKADSIVPKFNLEKGIENDYVLFGDHKVYYETTEEKNGVTVVVEAKKHHKQQYIDAVKSQLLYFPNIQFSIKHDTGIWEYVDYKADILYEDQYIVLSDNKMWSKPHLLLNKVNYGYINFDELELEHKSGNIGIKVDPEDVEINPSRESIIWSDKTKQMVLDRYKKVVDIATDFIQKELQETDFIKWLRVCYQISSRSRDNNSSVVNRLAGIIDLAEVKPYFPPEKRIRFNPVTIFEGFNVRLYNMETGRKANRNTKKVLRHPLESGISSVSWLPIIIIDENTSVRRDKYLLTKVYPEGFIGIKAPEWIGEDFSSTVITEGFLKQLDLFSDGGPANKSRVKSLLDEAPVLWEWLNKSSEVIKYSSVVVPSDFVCNEEDEEEETGTEEDQAEAEVAHTTAEERRKLEGKIVVHTPRFQPNFNNYYPPDYRFYAMHKLEVPIKELNEWDQEEIFYGNDDDLELIHLAAFITRENTANVSVPRNSQISMKHYTDEDYRCTHYFENPRIRIVKVARSNNKLFSDFKHIQKFFMEIKNEQVTMSNALIKWNTARQMMAGMNKMSFLWNFETFDQERSAKFRELIQYIKDNHAEVEANTKYSEFGITEAAYTDLVSHLDNVQAFQMFVAAGREPAEIAQFAAEVFGSPTIKGGVAIDLKIWQEYNDLLEYCQVLYPLLNELPVLTGVEPSETRQAPFDVHASRSTDEVCSEVEQEIRQYMVMKGVL